MQQESPRTHRKNSKIWMQIWTNKETEVAEGPARVKRLKTTLKKMRSESMEVFELQSQNLLVFNINNFNVFHRS